MGGQPVENARFRAYMCDSTVGYGDRTYHCSMLNRHLPIYDHYCHWLWMTAYLDTCKPYCGAGLDARNQMAL